MCLYCRVTGSKCTHKKHNVSVHGEKSDYKLVFKPNLNCQTQATDNEEHDILNVKSKEGRKTKLRENAVQAQSKSEIPGKDTLSLASLPPVTRSIAHTVTGSLPSIPFVTAEGILPIQYNPQKPAAHIEISGPEQILMEKAREHQRRSTTPNRRYSKDSLQTGQIHDKLKDKICGKCNFKTAYSRNLIAHFKAVHDNIKNWKCEKCNYKAVRRYNLQHHIEAVHHNIKNLTVANVITLQSAIILCNSMLNQSTIRSQIKYVKKREYLC